MDQEKKEEKKTTLQLKEEYLKERNAEIQSFYKELEDFCKERRIDIVGQFIGNENGNQIQIIIVDRQ